MEWEESKGWFSVWDKKLEDPTARQLTFHAVLPLLLYPLLIDLPHPPRRLTAAQTALAKEPGVPQKPRGGVLRAQTALGCPLYVWRSDLHPHRTGHVIEVPDQGLVPWHASASTARSLLGARRIERDQAGEPLAPRLLRLVCTPLLQLPRTLARSICSNLYRKRSSISLVLGLRVALASNL